MGSVYDQATLDAAFAAHDELLRPRNDTRDVTRCLNCGGVHLQRSANPGKCVQYFSICDDCGAVQPLAFGQTDAVFYQPSKISSNYKRIHHWHERISQLLLCESAIPDDQFLLIAERLCDGSHAVINKDVIRGVLRSLNMQLWIEKWLQIIQRVTLIEPPKPGAVLLVKLDRMFTELQKPFADFKRAGRKNFLNYNYVFCRLFQMIGCPQFSMFFPLIKSRAKLKALDETWELMVKTLKWEVTPLVTVPAFAVKLEQPELQLQRIRTRVDAAALAATHTAPARTGCRKSDLRLLHELDRQRELKRRRSGPPAQELQRPGSSVKPPRFVSAAKLLPLHRLRPPQRPV